MYKQCKSTFQLCVLSKNEAPSGSKRQNDFILARA